MTIKLEYLEREQKGRITASPELEQAVWARITGLATRVQPDLPIRGRVFDMDWAALLSMVARLADMRKQFGFGIEYSGGARDQLKRFREEYIALREPRTLPNLSEQSVQEQLGLLGFGRELKDHQRRDVVLMAAQRNGANFSVPGAGKTTVALAVHLLTNRDAHLLVVAPKNAFAAWDDVISESLIQSHPEADMTPFVRLEEGIDGVRAALRAEPRRAIISYDQLIRVPEVVADFMRSHRVHLIVDESHKMKSGGFSQRGAALLSIAHLPIRRDIMSGTPMPNALVDVVPQIDFLWPGQGLGRQIVVAENPAQILRPLYVRARKSELALPPVVKRHHAVTMSDAQLAFYSLVRDAILQRMAGVSANANIDLGAARMAVVRLLQISSNPVLAVRAMTSQQLDNFLHNDDTLEAIFTQVVAERDSPKLLATVALAREILTNDRSARVVIWSIFRENVERLSSLLSEFGATFIHGGVPVGDPNNLDTREGRIRAFHSNDLHGRVLVANPAACSEGISLHRVCHHAIYVDRSYNAAHFLQSVDRIHRLGLPPETLTYVHVMESVAPGVIGAIDYSVRRRLIDKLNMMANALEDIDLRQLALDEQEGEEPIDYDITLDDIVDLINELSGTAPEPGEELV
ncbi:MAG TPA: DEAD/DEAH box helicase [Candidatus Sulfotelmatobacter sp.]|jgi:SNF2 family DNA or RNA helicase